jgi:hypothetical protein
LKDALEQARAVFQMPEPEDVYADFSFRLFEPAATPETVSRSSLTIFHG